MQTVLLPLIQVVNIALQLYVWAIIISAIMSWLIAFDVINTRNQFVYMIVDFLWRITEPALRPIRQFLPNLGGIDISPIVLILGIFLAQRILGNIAMQLQTAGGPVAGGAPM
jgi:YggT family protein